MKLIIVCFASLLLALTGCMFNSTGIVPVGKGVYMVAKTSSGGGFVSAEGTKVELYREANSFCTNKGKLLETVKITGKDGRLFVRSASAELQFRCVKEDKEGNP